MAGLSKLHSCMLLVLLAPSKSHFDSRASAFGLAQAIAWAWRSRSAEWSGLLPPHSLSCLPPAHGRSDHLVWIQVTGVKSRAPTDCLKPPQVSCARIWRLEVALLRSWIVSPEHGPPVTPALLSAVCVYVQVGVCRLVCGLIYRVAWGQDTRNRFAPPLCTVHHRFVFSCVWWHVYNGEPKLKSANVQVCATVCGSLFGL